MTASTWCNESLYVALLIKLKLLIKNLQYKEFTVEVRE